MRPSDYISHLKPDFDVHAQLDAIYAVLNQNAEAEQAKVEAIQKAKEFAAQAKGELNVYACIQHDDLCHSSLYQDSAHSMAAVGMLAPLIETIFYQSFLGMRTQFFSDGDPSNNHPRWTRGGDNRWDCHFIYSGKGWEKNVVKGILDISVAVGVRAFWPANLESLLTALFAYRNKMFHNGLEWPINDRRAFAKRISEEKWQRWFTSATSGGEPWVYYLTEEFILDAFEMMQHVLDGFGAFIRDELLPVKAQS